MRTMKHGLMAVLAVAAITGMPAVRATAQEPRSNDQGAKPSRGTETLHAQQMADASKMAKVSMADAIRVAEDHCKGKAVCAVFCAGGEMADAKGGVRADNRTAGQPVYKVTVVSNGRFSCAKVNAETKEVIAQTDEGSALRMSIEPVTAVSQNTNQPTGNITGQTGQPAQTGQIDVGAGNRPEAFQFTHRWQKSKDLIGKAVKNAQNESLGKLEELAIDPQSGRIIYGVLSFGGFLGMGDKLFAIPWSSLKLNPDYKEITFNVDKENLKKASGFNKDAWPNMADQRWATETYKFYNQEPYWQSNYQTASDNERKAMTDEQRRATSYRDRWYQPASAWQKASDLTGKTAKAKQNSEDLGKLDELVIDPDSGRVIYGVLSYKSKLYAIPWSMWEMSPGYDHVIVTTTSEQLRNTTTGFDSSNWPNLADERTARGIYTYYNEPTYWESRNP